MATGLSVQEALRLTQSRGTSARQIEDLAWGWFAGEWGNSTPVREAIRTHPSASNRVKAAFAYLGRPITFDDVIGRLTNPTLEVSDRNRGYPAREVHPLLRSLAESVWAGRPVAELVPAGRLVQITNSSASAEIIPVYDKNLVDELIYWAIHASAIVCDPARYVPPKAGAQLPASGPIPIPDPVSPSPVATTRISQPSDHAAAAVRPPTTGALDELMGMIGLARVKQEAKELQVRALRAQSRRSRGLDPGPLLQHLVFLGNPGTGKTTVARLVGRLYHELGLLPTANVIEVTRSDIVSGNVGGTDEAARALIERAQGGVLFLDEAYSLVRNDSGWEQGRVILDHLVASMENHRDDFVLILAGYEREMTDFLAANPGLQSRLSEQWRFEDYTNQELAQIGRHYAASCDYTVDDDALAALRAVFQSMPRGPGFGNGRAARTVVEAAIDRLVMRQAGIPNAALSNDEISRLLPHDIDERLGTDFTADSEASVLRELDLLVGIQESKEAVRGYIRSTTVDRWRIAEDLPTGVVSRHMVFAGNPGTGKTTVASIIGRALKDAGVLRNGRFISVGRSDLVGHYIGESERRTRSVIESALGGVLFIDEAYSLTSNQSSNDFGQQAIDVLVELMEKYRDDLIVVAAGYPDEMARFVASNPGLSSRFTNWINFPDYATNELLEVWDSMVRAEELTCGEDARRAAARALEQAQAMPGFANARTVRNLLGASKTAQASRLFSANDRSRDGLTVLTRADVDAGAPAVTTPR